MSRRRRRLVVASLTVLFTAVLGQTAVTTVLPTALGDLGAPRAVGVVSAAYLAAAAASMLLYGRLGDRHGRSRVLAAALGLMLVGSLACAAAPTWQGLLAARVVEGLGAGGVLALTHAVVADAVPARERGTLAGAMAGVLAVAGTAGPLIAGLVAAVAGWRVVFVLGVPTGVVALVLLLTSAAAVRTSPVAGTGWGALSGDPTVRWGLVALLLSGAGQYAVWTYVPLLAQDALNLGPVTTGALMTVTLAGAAVTSWVVGRRITRHGRYRGYPVVGLGLATAGLAAIALAAALQSPWLCAGGLLLHGLGLGGSVPVLMLAVQNATVAERLGLATAAAQFSRLVGGAVAVGALGAALWVATAGRSPTTSAEDALAAGIGVVFAVATVTALAAALAAGRLEERPLGVVVPAPSASVS
jgi:MFS family permease